MSLLNQDRSLHNLFDAILAEIEVYKSSSAVYCSTENVDMLSTEGFFYLQKGKVYYGTQLTMKCPH